MFGTGTGLSIRAHGINYYGFKGDTLATGISVAEVNVVVTASQASIATGGTTTVNAAVTGAVNTGVRWQSLTPGIASVNNQGEVLGLQPGTALIRAQSLADLSKTDVVELTVIQLVADFSVSPAAGDSLTEFTFDASSSIGNITAFEWDFGDGNSANGQVVNHVFGASGVFDVTLTVTGDSGLQVSRSKQVSTTGRPLVVLNANPESGVAPLEVSFEGSASVSPTGVISHYNWDFGDGNSAEEADVTHTYVQNGSYYAKLTITDNAANSATDSVLIRVVSAPVASFTVIPESGQPPLEVTVDATASSAGEGNIILYTWDFGDGTVMEQGDSIENHLYVASGIFTIQLIIETSLGLKDTLQRNVEVGCKSLDGDFVITEAAQFEILDGVCKINGNLTFTDLSDVSTLPSFDNLTTVTNRLRIASNPNLVTINGFLNLRQVGSVDITRNDALLQLTGFFGLTETMNGITVDKNPILNSISAFNNINSVGGGLVIDRNPNLLSISGFNNIKRVSGQFFLDENPELSEVLAFTQLEDVGGTFRFNNTNYSACNILDIYFRIYEGGGFGIPGNIEIIGNPGTRDVTNLFISTQQQFDDFEGVCLVNGALRIFTELSEISGLESLRRTDLLDIVTSPNITDLNFLPNLEQVGAFSLAFNAGIETLNGLESLRHADEIMINGEPLLTDIDALSGIRLSNGSWTLLSTGVINIPEFEYIAPETGSGPNITIVDNPSLTNFDAFRVFTGVSGLLIENNPSLVSLAGLENVTTIGVGFAQIRNNPALVSLEGMHNIESAPNGQSIILDGNGITDLTGLRGLKTLGILRIVNSPALQSLNGLSNLTIADIELTISGNPVLANLDGLDGLVSVGGTGIGDLNIINNAALQNINALSGLAFARRLQILNNMNLVNLDGLENLDSPLNILRIEDNGSLQNIDGLSGITAVSNQLKIINNAQLLHVNGLSGVSAGIPGELTITNNAQLQHVDGLSGISGNVTTLSITQNPSLTSISGLAGITSTNLIDIIGNGVITLEGLNNLTTALTMQVRNNPSLLHMDDLEALERVTGFIIRVSGNTSLQRVSGMTSLSRVAGQFRISGNQILPSCDVQKLIDQLQSREGIGGPINVTDNDPDGVCIP